jgi:hypothetical protein
MHDDYSPLQAEEMQIKACYELVDSVYLLS